MKFSFIEKTMVMEESGFIVFSRSRYNTGYIDNQKNKWIFIEHEAIKNGWVIYKKTLKTWQTPNGEQPISESEKDNIAKKIAEALKAMGNEIVEIA